ncbi:hypothetical protein ATJ88_2559 [Isoptericola jiangsuensis]|uniref:Uncharacterized protein n=1 Tax=Isoptericola jiangsuensis TaxID=548579 RepID=A0A2A9EZ62_9MICO|nr:hypothetical protein [Isoptericola jiangsuensis]PFG43846.1 hypothetical protein ATJ88_2559 [Isoptericola jiangsuensis]
MNHPQRPDGQDDATRAYPSRPGTPAPGTPGGPTYDATGAPAVPGYDAPTPVGHHDAPPGVVPAADDPAYDPVVDTGPTQPGLIVTRYWSGAAVTVLVSALLGLACSVVLEEVFGLSLVAPPDALGVGHHASWAGTGALYALLAAVVLQLLVLAAPRARMFFGWLVALSILILVALPFTGSTDPLDATMTGLVWVVLGVAVFSMLSGVLGRTLVRRPTT